MTHDSEEIERFPSVPFVDIDLFLNDGVGACGSNLQSMTSCRMLEGMDVSKAAIVTTGIPGSPCPEGFEGPKTSGESPKSFLNDSPKSFLSAWSLLESTPSSQRTGVDQRSVKILGPDQLTIAGSVDSAPAGDSQLRRSLRSHGTDDKQLAGKRKVGRPIAYCGDPNSPDLTPAERRRIMRRIANRESARRVRARRLDVLGEMTQKAKEMEEANARLLERLASVESKHSAVLSEAQALDSDLRAKSAQNEELQAQVRQLRASLSPKAADAAKGVIWSASGPQQPATSACSFSASAENLAPVPGMLSNADSGSILFSSPRQGTLPDGCALLPANAPAHGNPSGGAPFPLFTAAADATMPLQLDQIDRSFSDFLIDEFTVAESVPVI